MSQNLDKFDFTSDPLVDIPALIKWRGNGLTFIELLKYLPYLRGDKSISFASEGMVLWVNVSDQCIDAIEILVKEQAISMNPTSTLTYLADGGGLKLPIAKRAQKYKNAHWLPVTFSLIEKKAA
jgi:hypothetical protein